MRIKSREKVCITCSIKGDDSVPTGIAKSARSKFKEASVSVGPDPRGFGSPELSRAASPLGR